MIDPDFLVLTPLECGLEPGPASNEQEYSKSNGRSLLRQSPLSVCSLWRSQLPRCGRWAALWRSSRGKELRAASSQKPRRNGGLHSNNPRGAASCQQPCDCAWRRPSPRQAATGPQAATMWLYLWQTLSQRTQLSQPWIPHHRNFEIIHVP